jgi:hypothetical protein
MTTARTSPPVGARRGRRRKVCARARLSIMVGFGEGWCVLKPSHVSKSTAPSSLCHHPPLFPHPIHTPHPVAALGASAGEAGTLGASGLFVSPPAILRRPAGSAAVAPATAAPAQPPAPAMGTWYRLASSRAVLPTPKVGTRTHATPPPPPAWVCSDRLWPGAHVRRLEPEVGLQERGGMRQAVPWLLMCSTRVAVTSRRDNTLGRWAPQASRSPLLPLLHVNLPHPRQVS